MSTCVAARPARGQFKPGLQLSRWEIDQDDIGVFFKTSENNFFSVRRDIEIADEKLFVDVG
jgi:hypothetical protein